MAIRKAAPSGALADPGLEHPELAALDGELDVAEILVVVLQRLHDLHELVVRLLVDRLQVGERHRVADTGDDVLALRVLEVVAVDALVAAGRVAGEGDARAGVGAQVAEDHRADVDGRAEVAGDALLAAVELGPVGVPRVEDRVYGQVHLLAGVLREHASGLGLDDLLELLDELLEVGRGEVGVDRDLLRFLGRLQRLLEEVAVDPEDGLAEHLDEAAVGVPGEALVAGLGGETGHRGVGEADVQDRVHHARHGELGAGADGDQQRVVGLPEPLAHALFQRLEVRTHLVAQRGRRVAAVQVDLAGLGGDREARRDGQPEVGHLGEVRTLAAQKILQILVALGEVVDELLGIFVFRHGSRLLEDAVAALTARNIPRSKVDGYVHLVVIRPQPPVRQQIERLARPKHLTFRFHLLNATWLKLDPSRSPERAIRQVSSLLESSRVALSATSSRSAVMLKTLI